jgi:hypothetical protein
MPTERAKRPGETVLLKILIVGALAIGLMAVIRDGRVLKDAGLLSKCSPVAVDGRSDPTVLSCTRGRLDGFPDLTNKSCSLISLHPKTEYWRCDAPIVTSQTPTG